MFFGVFIHSPDKYLWHTCCVPSTALSKKSRAVFPACHRTECDGDQQIGNNHTGTNRHLQLRHMLHRWGPFPVLKYDKGGSPCWRDLCSVSQDVMSELRSGGTRLTHMKWGRKWMCKTLRGGVGGATRYLSENERHTHGG